MNLGLSEKVVVITGGGSGIGLAAALEYAREGAKVAICGRSAERLSKAAEVFRQAGFADRLFYRTCNVTLKKDVEAFAAAVSEELGPIDIWVNNAGANIIKPLTGFDEDDYQFLVDINLKSFIICSNEAARLMKGRGGVIVNASSFSAVIPNAGRGLYSACKSAVLSLTRTYAGELAAYGIRVVAYIPGQIETEMTENIYATIPREQLVANIAMRRLGTAEDLAKPIVFISSPAAGYMNGSAIEVAGAKFCVQNPGYSWEEKDDAED